jgi:hypothetical protein
MDEHQWLTERFEENRGPPQGGPTWTLVILQPCSEGNDRERFDLNPDVVLFGS